MGQSPTYFIFSDLNINLCVFNGGKRGKEPFMNSYIIYQGFYSLFLYVRCVLSPKLGSLPHFHSGSYSHLFRSNLVLLPSPDPKSLPKVLSHKVFWKDTKKSFWASVLLPYNNKTVLTPFPVIFEILLFFRYVFFRDRFILFLFSSRTEIRELPYVLF